MPLPADTSMLDWAVGAATPAMREAFGRLTAAFKAAYSTETLKAAVVAGEAIDSELEERLTSALVIFNRERTLSGAHATLP